MKFSGKVWSDHGTTWLNLGSIRVNESAGQRPICLLSASPLSYSWWLSPAIAQRTGVNKSVSFARLQQGAGFVVPRTTACFLCLFYRLCWKTAFGVTANVALHKTASLSSTYQQKVPENANDDDLATAACTRYTTPEPWWTVDLESPMDISCVCVTNDGNKYYGE